MKLTVLSALCAWFLLGAVGTASESAPSDENASVVRRTTLIVHDLDASIRFYRDVLGFELWLENNGKVTGDSLPSDAALGATSRFVIMKGKDPWIGMVGLLEYGGPKQLPKTPKRLVPGDAILMIETAEIDAIYQRMQRVGTPILKHPKTQTVTGANGTRWDAKFLFAWDPDGHLLEINQPGIGARAAGVVPVKTAAAPAVVRREFQDGIYGQLHVRRIEPSPSTERHAPIYLLHQTPLSGRMFSEVLPELARDRVVVAPDTPGYGESAGPRSAPTIEQYADALYEVIARAGEPVDLVGYHTGAMLAAVLAARHPRAVRRLVLISMPLFDAERRRGLRATAPLEIDGTHLTNDWKSTMSVRPDGQSLELAARLVAEKQRAGSNAAFAMAALAAFDAEPTLRSLRVPTTLIRPRDGLWDNTAAAAKIIPGARLVDMPHWTYGFFDADPKGVAELIIESLQDRP
jgi:pimeloyl-ACP methyl ester carboxylesterase